MQKMWVLSSPANLVLKGKVGGGKAGEKGATSMRAPVERKHAGDFEGFLENQLEETEERRGKLYC